MPDPGPELLVALRLDVEPVFPDLSFSRLTNFAQPDDGSDLFFVTEQEGRIRVFSNDRETENAGTFLDISDRVSRANNEEGLLSLAFDPDYGSNGAFYVYYSASNPRRSVLSRFLVDADNARMADRQSELVIMEIEQPFGNHNGGHISFGPDGYLYVGLGDGGSGGDPMGHGQDTGSLLGSMLRIDVSTTVRGESYRVPEDNPFLDVPGARGEVWAYGFRNPWRFSFDSQTGSLWLGDVGQNDWEEVDVVGKGHNYGWNVMEGRHCFSPRRGCDEEGLEMPVWEYPLSGGNCSVIGGYVYHGSRLPALASAYIYADFCSGKVWALRYDGESVTEQALLVESGLNITSFGEDREGNLYVLSQREGIYRLLPSE